MNKISWLAILFFFAGVLLLTRIDYLVHDILYDYGLIFSYVWADEYWLLYSLSYHLLIIILFLWTKNKYFFLAAEVFVLTATPDLIFFGVWKGSFPTIDWWWMSFHNLFGFWSTFDQIFLSIMANGFVLLGFSVHKFYFESKWKTWNFIQKLKSIRSRDIQ